MYAEFAAVNFAAPYADDMACVASVDGQIDNPVVVLFVHFDTSVFVALPVVEFGSLVVAFDVEDTFAGSVDVSFAEELAGPVVELAGAAAQPVAFDVHAC